MTAQDRHNELLRAIQQDARAPANTLSAQLPMHEVVKWIVIATVAFFAWRESVSVNGSDLAGSVALLNQKV